MEIGDKIIWMGDRFAAVKTAPVAIGDKVIYDPAKNIVLHPGVVEIGKDVLLLNTKTARVPVPEHVQSWIIPHWEHNFITCGSGIYTKTITTPVRAQRTVWFDRNDCIWFYYQKMYKIQMPSLVISSYDISSTDINGRFSLGNDDFYIVKQSNALECRANDGFLTYKWAYTLPGTPYDVQCDHNNNQIVCGNWTSNVISVLDLNGSLVFQKDIGMKSQQIAIDKNHNYWFQEYHGSHVKVVDSSNGDILNSYSAIGGLSNMNGCGENQNYDIMVGSRYSNVINVFLASDGYSQHSYTLDHNAYKISNIGSAFLIVDFDGGFVTHFDYYRQTQQTFSVGTYPYAHGDPGLMRYLTWKRNWVPNKKTIQNYVLG